MKLKASGSSRNNPSPPPAQGEMGAREVKTFLRRDDTSLRARKHHLVDIVRSPAQATRERGCKRQGALGLARRSLRSPLEMKSFSLVMATTSRGRKNKPCKMSVFPRRLLVSLSKRGILLGLLRRTVQTSTVVFQVQVR